MDNDRRETEIGAVARAANPAFDAATHDETRKAWLREAERYIAALDAVRARSPQGEDHEPCPTCGGRGWHTACGNDPIVCGRCPAGEAWALGEDGPVT